MHNYSPELEDWDPPTNETEKKMGKMRERKAVKKAKVASHRWNREGDSAFIADTETRAVVNRCVHGKDHIIRGLRKEISGMTSDMERTDGEMQVLLEDVRALRESRDVLVAEKEALTSQLADANARNSDLHGRNRRLSEQNAKDRDEFGGEIARLNDELGRLLAQGRAYSETLDEKNLELSRVRRTAAIYATIFIAVRDSADPATKIQIFDQIAKDSGSTDDMLGDAPLKAHIEGSRIFTELIWKKKAERKKRSSSPEAVPGEPVDIGSILGLGLFMDMIGRAGRAHS